MIKAISFVLDNYAKAMARQNARIIIENATAYPFRLPEGSAVCVYCYEAFDDPAIFRKHMEAEHENFKAYLAFAHVHEGYIKADCTELRCRACSKDFKNIEDTAIHLKDAHGKGINMDYNLGLQPFTIDKDRWFCAICPSKFSNLRSLSRHTQQHFVQFTCDTCGKSYSTSTSLNHHINFSHTARSNEKLCRKCKKPFSSMNGLRDHLERSKNCCQHVCSICGERFPTWVMKQSHMTDAHAAPKKVYKCPGCEEVFNKPDSCRIHFKLVHTDEHFDCSCCGRKYETEYKLQRHMVSHTGEKHFECSVCSKAFPRKSTLDQHMWIHREVKKWKCESCDKQFNQKVSWKTHMKAHHPEFSNF